MNHRPRKRFGQNFLHDRTVIERIHSAIAAHPGEALAEIGPGQGAITEGLLQAAGALDAIEFDRDLVGPLQERLAPLGDLRVHQADALSFDFCQLVTPPQRLRLVGNLPYNISTPILFHVLERADCIDDMHFMLQREVVERMAAPPGSKTYGRLSVMLQVHCQVTPLFDIRPGAFHPPPKVDSAFVRLTPYRPARFAIADPALFARLVANAFAQRRKTLRNALRQDVTEAQFSAAGIDPGLRAEVLSPQQFVELAEIVATASPDAP